MQNYIRTHIIQSKQSSVHILPIQGILAITGLQFKAENSRQKSCRIGKAKKGMQNRHKLCAEFPKFSCRIMQSLTYAIYY